MREKCVERKPKSKGVKWNRKEKESNLGLWYPKNSTCNLIGYFDSGKDVGHFTATWEL